MLKLLYFARLREDLGTGIEEMALPPGVTTVAGLRAHLVARGGTWASVLANGKALRVAVNQDMAEPSTPIKAGDEVAFFPPVTGG
ncbi:MAG TPA: molybdopterin converting factor subunit 1 [Burkholderiales bacterium]|jgi:molybdopterin synthase sulfur carrier subunit|nr:molybdopterin converting factor subunit 1 [Burkholderiales bacterium]